MFRKYNRIGQSVVLERCFHRLSRRYKFGVLEAEFFKLLPVLVACKAENIVLNYAT